ncbi:MAG: DUF1648 domain-containing protein [Saprospiraceae bacterium]|nr:DUF1648 domain-containing protein [Saprospiraceae bacterium]MCB0543113.1 DUF1648 domain-containing protein [Saprospiraceae bacterium]MCB0574454.1 DUF1648 domain-containing protein [Saprospiraceae bacterium]MCB9306453.1 DUF1648 domain-containing protein [Lewinellaceae bacterium]MCB9355437.1 DUF1648 domain-containing protein [Lewinellaceae bacterium]
MKNQPVIEVPKTALERWLDIFSLLFVALSVALVATYYSDLPDTIPTHFNGAGKVDGYGSKNTIFLLPVLSLILVPGILLLSRYPHKFNYLTKITPENAAFEYKKAQVMVRIMNVLVSALFLLLTWEIVQAALGRYFGLGPLFWILIVLTLILPWAIAFGWKQKKAA